MKTDEAPNEAKTAREIVVEILLAFAIFFPGSLFTFAVGWHLERRFETRIKERRAITTAVCVLNVLLLALVGIGNYASVLIKVATSLSQRQWLLALESSVLVFVVGLPMGVALGMLTRRLYEWIQGRHPLKGPRVREDKRQRLIGARARLVKAASMPLVIGGLPVLGAWLDGDDNQLRRGDWAVMDEQIIHAVALGATGSGKTTLIKSLIEGHLSLGNQGGEPWSVIVIDGKEDPEAAAWLLGAAQRHGVAPSRIRIWPQSGPIDLLRGTPDQVLDRIHGLANWTEPYYEQVAKLALRLALDDPRGLPKTLGELLNRLDATALKATWAGTDRAELASRLTSELVGGVRMRYYSLNKSLEIVGAVPTVFSHAAWSWEDAEAIWICLPTSTTPVVASGLGRALLLDLISYIRSQRRISCNRILLVVEELGGIVGDDPVMARTLSETLERARSAGVRVILSGQSPESLGEPATQSRLLRSGSSILAMRMPFPEPVLELLGTRSRPEASLGVNIDGTHLPQGSMRLQQQFAVTPDEIRQLPVGRVCLIHQGKFTLLQVPPSRSA